MKQIIIIFIIADPISASPFLTTLLSFLQTIWSLLKLDQEWYLKWHNSDQHYLSFFPVAFYSFVDSIYAFFSSFQFHINQRQNIFHRYDLPLCILCRILWDDLNSKSAILSSHVCRIEDTQYNLRLRNLCLSIYNLFQQFHIKYWSLKVTYLRFQLILLIFCKSDNAL